MNQYDSCESCTVIYSISDSYDSEGESYQSESCPSESCPRR